MLDYARGMGAGTHIVNVLVLVQEAILAREIRRPTDDRLRRTMTHASQLRAAPL
jgi:hypothetical protein